MTLPEPLHSVTMRQISSKINLFWSRDHYMQEIFSQEELEEREKIHCIYKNIVPQVTQEEFNTIRQKYKVSWIIIDVNSKDIINYLDETSPTEKKQIGEYLLYHYC